MKQMNLKGYDGIYWGEGGPGLKQVRVFIPRVFVLHCRAIRYPYEIDMFSQDRRDIQTAEREYKKGNGKFSIPISKTEVNRIIAAGRGFKSAKDRFTLSRGRLVNLLAERLCAY